MSGSEANSESINPLTRESYTIPQNVDDKLQLDRFLEANANNKVVVVQGLGFVGAAMALVCANAAHADYAVIGVDLATTESYWKIASINAGICPIVSGDTKIQQLFDAAHEKGNLIATSDPYAYSLADVIIVDINLDVQKNSKEDGTILDYSVSVFPLESSASVIGKNCKEDVLVLVETTVPPGSCEKIYNKVIKQELENRNASMHRFSIGHSYERVMPGPGYIDSIINFYRVYSGVDQKSADETEKFLSSIINTENYPLTRLSSTTATESAKILENSYRAMNIAFVEEWGRFAEEAGYNLYEVIDAIRLRPTHKNLMYPGLGVGGYCLTKDPLLASWARQEFFGGDSALTKSVLGVESNDKMPHNVYDLVRGFVGHEVSSKSILILGVSYRSEVADTRYTPVEVIYRRLIEDGATVRLHDFYVGFWEECNCPVETDITNVLDVDYDCVIVCTGHSQYKDNQEMLDWFDTQNGVFVYDAVGVLSQYSINKIAQNNKVKIVGRGDI